MTQSEELDPWKDVILTQNRGWLKAYVLTMTGDPGAAEDLVQDVFMVAFRKRNEFERGTNFGGWLREIARRVCLDHGKKKSRRLNLNQVAKKRLQEAASALRERQLDPALQEEKRSRLVKCLSKLNHNLQHILSLRYGEGKSLNHIATLTARSVTAVGVSLFRARTTLADCIRTPELK